MQKQKVIKTSDFKHLTRLVIHQSTKINKVVLCEIQPQLFYNQRFSHTDIKRTVRDNHKTITVL